MAMQLFHYPLIKLKEFINCFIPHQSIFEKTLQIASPELWIANQGTSPVIRWSPPPSWRGNTLLFLEIPVLIQNTFFHKNEFNLNFGFNFRYVVGGPCWQVLRGRDHCNCCSWDQSTPLFAVPDSSPPILPTLSSPSVSIKLVSYGP